MRMTLRNDSGLVKSVKVGFSWTTLFFGGFPALFRGDLKWALIQLIAACCTCGASCLVFCFIYNKIYFRELTEKGYKLSA